MAKCLYRIDDENNPNQVIELWEDKKTRWMSFGNEFIQSAMDIRTPSRLILDYMFPMMAVLEFVPNAKNGLILGLGGGAMVRYLSHYHPSISLTAIEQNQTIVAIAQQFFELPAEKINTIITDGLRFMETEQNQFDLIWVDLFNQTKVPQGAQQENFYRHCESRLSKEGAIAFNLIPQDNRELDYLLKCIREIFSHQTLTFYIKKHQNVVVIASKNPNYSKIINTLMTEKRLEKVSLDSTYGTIAEKYTPAF